MLIFKNFISR